MSTPPHAPKSGPTSPHTASAGAPSTGTSTPTHSGKSAATSTGHTNTTTSPAVTPTSTAPSTAPPSGATTPKKDHPGHKHDEPKHMEGKPPVNKHDEPKHTEGKPPVNKQDEPKPIDAKPKPDAVKKDTRPPPAPPRTAKKKEEGKEKEEKLPKKKRVPCPPHLCTLVPANVPAPELTQAILHPRKDVFVLKVAKVGPNGDRRCRMELELVTPKSYEKTHPYRLDTRETQFDPECTCCCCSKEAGRRK